MGLTARAVAVVGLAAPVPRATAQQPATAADSAPAQLRSTLRAFYFSLAHQDWEALSAHILPAKVVAHRPAPEAIVAASTRLPVGDLPPASSPAGDGPACSSPVSAPVEDAAILLRDDWAEVSVARCGRAAESDRFRLIRFESRWWIVFVDLVRAPAAVRVAR